MNEARLGEAIRRTEKALEVLDPRDVDWPYLRLALDQMLTQWQLMQLAKRKDDA